MKYRLLADQTIEYYVLHALEAGMVDASTIRKHLIKELHPYSGKQISGALQRLKKDGLAVLKKTPVGVIWKLGNNKV